MAATLLVSAYSFQLADPLTIDSGTIDAQAWTDSNYPVPAGFEALVVVDGLDNETPNMNPAKEAAGWLRTRHDGELVLISALANDVFMFHSGLRQDRFVFEGAQPYWDDELEEPGIWTGWAVLRTGYFRDLVDVRLADRIKNSPRFELAFENESYKIFRVVSPATRAE